MFIQAALIPSGFSAGLAAALTAGISAVLLIPFFVLLVKMIRRSGGLPGWKLKSILVALLVVLFAIALSEATSQPYFCQLCHAMKPSASSWRSGPHKDVSCLSCHREKGFGGVTIRKLEDIRMVWGAFVGSRPQGLNKPIRDEVCLGCHAGESKGDIVQKNGIKVTHKDFAAGSLLCIECHFDASHGKPQKSAASVMERCTVCHDGKKAPADCSTCHLKRFSKRIAPGKSSGIDHGDRWIERHGVKSQGICGACHVPADCSRCHVEMPHPEGWSLEHGRQAEASGGKCLECHIGGRACDNCHQLPMPHPAGWLKSHAINANQRGKEVCLICHLDRDCSSCHDEHKNLPQVRKVKALGK